MAFVRSLSALALSLALGAPAAATTISFQNGFDGYTGADNESYSFDGTTSQDQIRVDLPNAAQPDGSYAWVIFDGIFGAGAVPEGSVILSATFEGFVRNPFIVADMTRALDDIANRPYGPGTDVLSAGGVFWDNKQSVPAFHADCGNLVECDPPVPVAWDVTDIVQAWADGATNFGFLLLPETTNGGKLFATDDPHPALRPRLVIEFSSAVVPPSVPEPALLTLLVLAFVIAAARRA
ncbi:MAG: DNRLRE domain-containing protein [Myxococcota bacterium]